MDTFQIIIYLIEIQTLSTDILYARCFTRIRSRGDLMQPTHVERKKNIKKIGGFMSRIRIRLKYLASRSCFPFTNDNSTLTLKNSQSSSTKFSDNTFTINTVEWCKIANDKLVNKIAMKSNE